MSVELITLPGIPLVRGGDDLVDLIVAGLMRGDVVLRDGDIVVLAQKIVSKAEGRLVELASVTPTARAIELGVKCEKDPRLVQLVLSEATSIVLVKPGSLLVEHRLGFVMPMAGLDQSNIGLGDSQALLLPVDPDSSAEILRWRLSERFDVDLAVIINDSVSRPWRSGTCGVAIGSAGLPVLHDMRGQLDLFGRELKFSISGFADEIASAASLVMGQRDEGTPVVVVRGLKWNGFNNTASEILVRPSELTPELVERV